MTNHDGLRLKQAYDTLVGFNLNPAHLDVISNSSINVSANLPYHNFQHLISVGLATVELSKYYFSSALDNPMSKLLFLAGLYHDFNHTNGANTDIVNVCKAVTGMVEIIGSVEPDLSNTDINTISRLILSTEHPARNTPNGMEEKIIRDSDMLQWCEPDFERWASGLSLEMGMPVTFETTKKFLSKQVIYTYKARTSMMKIGLLRSDW